ncbi:NAD-dependent DNA ligase LigA [Candidatus Shapirobacteria bacterium]|nr:NAD-dependent DNA ligase LigA [Candidatus Shapirobacteria bacterium]
MVTLDSLNLQKISPEELGELLIEAKKAYYTGSKPIMDDHTYDTLEEILKKKLPYHRIFTKVGHPNFDTGFEKKKHLMPMGSQNKVTNLNDLVHYFELKNKDLLKNSSSPLVKGGTEGGLDWGWIVQPKCDGISLEIEYRSGQIVNAITRGDGEVGDIITQNVVKMQNYINNPKKFTGSVRCEIVVTKKDFEKLNKTSEEKYSNPRNAASGLSQRLDSKYAEYCSLYAVDIFFDSRRDVARYVSTENQKIDYLTSLGFTPVESTLCNSFDDIEKIYQEFFVSKRLSYPFEIDGLVIKINDLSLSKKLGTKNNRPKYQVAYKFPSQSNQTVIKSVVWQVGPMGLVTPVAEVEPLELSGAMVTFASLANYALVKEKDLNIGDIIQISRRGDVIPHIEKVITKVNLGHTKIPTHCPTCNTKLIIEDKFLRCPNTPQCLDQIIGSLRLFCDTLGFLGLSDKTIRKLYTAGKVVVPGDFYKLTIDDISTLDNLGEKSAKNILHQINKKRELSLVEAFDASIIPNFSAKRVQQVIDGGFDTPEKILNLTTTNLLTLKGFQITLAQKIIDGISLRRPWIESIISNVVIRKSYILNLKSLSGLSFAITGDLSLPRKDLEKLIIDNGGKVASTVSKNTSYLITNEVDSNSSKFVTAKKLNIKIIDEKQFNKILSSPSLSKEGARG